MYTKSVIEEEMYMDIGMAFAIFALIFDITIIVVGAVLAVLLIKALMKYLRTPKSETNEIGNVSEKAALGEVLKQCRTEKNMTQEFVAQSLNVSRQAVSKWEKGTSEPSTSNLMALCKLYEVSADDILKRTEA